MSKNTPIKENLIECPPVIVVMGHVDHGKSALLDYIRNTNVVDGEAGGITQHVSAYEVEHKTEDGSIKKITFLDTPGHEAFGKIRSRGAATADIAILVVSAEDGVKKQTLEALDAIKKAEIPFVIAINKIDKPNADIQRTKNNLIENEIYIEGMGGDISFVPISAKTGEGIPELLDTLLLTAEMQELQGNTSKNATGSVIESNRDLKKGVAATLIIKDGTIKLGQFVLAGESIAPVRIMENHSGEQIKEACFSCPIRIIGFDSLPLVGSIFTVFNSKKEAEKARDIFKAEQKESGIRTHEPTKKFVISLIVKTDVSGTLEAIEHELEKLETEKTIVRIVQAGIGSISENDVKSTLSGENTLLIGFGVSIDRNAQEAARQHEVDIHTFDIIYKLSEWLEEKIIEMTPKQTIEKIVGKAKVLKYFSTTKNTHVIGARVLEGVIKKDTQIHVSRRDTHITDAKFINLQQQKQDTDLISDGEFGGQIESKMEIAPGDILECFEMIEE